MFMLLLLVHSFDVISAHTLLLLSQDFLCKMSFITMNSFLHAWPKRDCFLFLILLSGSFGASSSLRMLLFDITISSQAATDPHFLLNSSLTFHPIQFFWVSILVHTSWVSKTNTFHASICMSSFCG